MDIYAENILDHYRHPRHKGALDEPTVSQHEKNPACGDEVTMHLKINDNRVTQILWEGDGCAISQAAMSMLSEELVGKTLDELNDMNPRSILDLLNVPISPRRMKCALLCLHVLKNTLHQLEGAEPQTWVETVGNAAKPS